MNLNQILGSFSSGGIQITMDCENDVVQNLGHLSQNRYEKIPLHLIKECDDKYEKTGIPHLILDSSDKYKINRYPDKQTERDLDIKYLLGDKFEVVSWYDLMDMPSRETFYDSITKHTDLFERHKKVLMFLNSIDFFITDLLESGLSQQELLFNSFNREISYISQQMPNFIIRIKPNLIMEMLISNGDIDSVEINKKYFFYYNPKRIMELIIENSNIETSRDFKLKLLYEH
jgi:hypothetical protein